MLSAREVAALTGWPIRTVRYKAQTGQLLAKSVLNIRNRKEYLFPLDGLPMQAQRRHYEQQGASLPAPPKETLEKVQVTPERRTLDSYTDSDREQIRFWQDVIEQWTLYRSQPGKPLSELDQKFVQHMCVEHPGMKLSVATLYRKKKALEEGDLESVIDRRGKARKGKTDMPEHILNCGEGAACRQSKPMGISSSESWKCTSTD